MNAYLNGYDWSRFVAAVKLANPADLARADRAERLNRFRAGIRSAADEINATEGYYPLGGEALD